MERRGRIPIATFRTPEGKPRSRSRVRERNHVDSDPEMDMFTLLEENFALKEENKKMNNKISEYMENVKSLEEDNLELQIQIKKLKEKKSEKLKELKNNPIQPNFTILSNNMKKGQFEIRDEYTSVINKQTKEEFMKMFTASTNEFESLLDFGEEKTDLIPFNSIQSLLNEFSQLKCNFNSIELQLYEANEKISELLECQTLLEDGNEKLKLALANNLQSKEKVLQDQNGSGTMKQVFKQKESNSSEHEVTKQRPESDIERDNTRGERIIEVVLTL